MSHPPPKRTLYGEMPAQAANLVSRSGERPRLAEVRPLPVHRDDRALVDGMIAGKSWASVAFFDRYAGDVLRVLTRVLGHDPAIPDIVQDVFVRALEGIDRLEQPCGPSSSCAQA